MLPQGHQNTPKIHKKSKKGRSFPLFFIVCGWSFRRQSTLRMLIWYKLWGMIYHIALLLSSSSVPRLPTCPCGGTLFSCNISFYFLILFMFLFFFLFVLQRSRIHHSSSKIVQEIKRKKTHCCVHGPESIIAAQRSSKKSNERRPTAACTRCAGCPPLPSATATRLPHPQFCLSWVSRLPPCSLALMQTRPRNKNI
jgi:hypothetical protein